MSPIVMALSNMLLMEVFLLLFDIPRAHNAIPSMTDMPILLWNHITANWKPRLKTIMTGNNLLYVEASSSGLNRVDRPGRLAIKITSI